jgi:transposase
VNKTFTDLDEQGLDALIQRVSEAKEHGLALSPEDTQLLLDALMTLAHLQERLQDKDVTLHKLRKLLGLVKSSEKLRDLIAGEPPKQPSSAKRPAKKKAPAQAVKPRRELHKLQGLTKGDPCPVCPLGKLYKFEPASLLRIEGHSPFTPVLHLCERLRCNACGEFYTAELPPEVLADGSSTQKYGYSARSLMAINKFFGGTPFYRQESLQNLLGVSISASTAFDQCEQVGNACQPVFKVFKTLAAQALHFNIDDTSNRIVTQQPVMKKRRNSDQETLRSGVYSSGLIASLETGQAIILYQTDVGHAGEFLDDILRQRAPGQPPPLVMSDALSHNHVTCASVEVTLCNAHGRRQFVDVINPFPDEVAWVIEQYGRIWQHEDAVREQGLSEAERTAYHHAHSLPVMAGLRQWGQDKLTSGAVEENSGLGKAIRYFERHYERLIAFCHQPGAQLDNNVMEQQLKLIVRNRKNANFYKTAAGAAIGDVITSVIATCAQAGVNVLEYLNALQRNPLAVKAHPEQWLPWNYPQDTTA